MADWVTWLALALAIIAIIAIILIVIELFRLGFNQQFAMDLPLIAKGALFTIVQQGITNQNVDQLSNGGSIVYIGRSNQALTLTFPPGRVVVGTVVQIVATVFPITIFQAPGSVIIDPGIQTDVSNGLTINSHSVGQYVVTGANTYVRTI